VFCNSGFHKKQAKNCLLCHLDLCTQFYAQRFDKFEGFPFEEAIILWGNMKTQYYIDS